MNARQCTGGRCRVALPRLRLFGERSDFPSVTNVSERSNHDRGVPTIYRGGHTGDAVFLDREATWQRRRLIEEVAADGSRLIVFPEAFIPGYPFWLWRDRPDDMPGLEQKAFAALWRESIDVPDPRQSSSVMPHGRILCCHRCQRAGVGVRPRYALQHGLDVRSGWATYRPAPQTCPDVPRAHGLGTG